MLTWRSAANEARPLFSAGLQTVPFANDRFAAPLGGRERTSLVGRRPPEQVALTVSLFSYSLRENGGRQFLYNLVMIGSIAPSLTLESIWEDESLFEVRVRASNGSFSGSADCYTNRDQIESLAMLIEGFPKSPEHEVHFTTGESESFSFLSIALKAQDRLGHLVARIKIAHIETHSNVPSESSVSEFDIRVEPAAIDAFVLSLRHLSRDGVGQVTAELRGKT